MSSFRRKLLNNDNKWDYNWMYDPQNPTLPPDMTYKSYSFEDDYVEVLNPNLSFDDGKYCEFEITCSLEGINEPQTVIISETNRGIKVYPYQQRIHILANQIKAQTDFNSNTINAINMVYNSNGFDITINGIPIARNASYYESQWMTATGLHSTENTSALSKIKEMKFKYL